MEIITLLNDDETWTSIAGTKVVVLTPEDFTEVENGHKPMSLATKAYDLTNPVHLRLLADEIENLRQ